MIGIKPKNQSQKNTIDFLIGKVYNLLSKTMHKSISEIAPYVEFGKSKVTTLLKSMAEKGIVSIEGKGRGTKYHL